LLFLVPLSHATAVKLTTDHSEYAPSSSILISGVVLGDDWAEYVGASAIINLSGLETTTALNRTSDAVSFSASVTAPPTEGNHRYIVTVSKAGQATLVGHGVLKVRNIAAISLSKDQSEYFLGESVAITVAVRNSTGDPYSGFSLELRLFNSTGDAVYSEQASANANGTKIFSLSGLSAGDYTAVVNDVSSLKFSVSVFTASLLIADSSGNPSLLFRNGDAASLRVQVLKNNRPLASSEASSYQVSGSVTTPLSGYSNPAFSFRNGTFVADYNVSSGSGKYAVSATVNSNTTIRLYSAFYVNDYKVDVFPVYTSSSYSGSFASGENVILAARIINLSSGGYVENASLVVSVYDSDNKQVNLSYSALPPSEASDTYFQTNHLFSITIQPPSESGRYSLIVNVTVAGANSSGFGEFYISSLVINAYTVSADGSPKSVFSLDDTIRIKANAYNMNGTIAISSLKLVSLRDSQMREISVAPTYNLTTGIISFNAPRRGSWYTAEVLVNGASTGYASFLVHLYEVRAIVKKNGTSTVSGYYGWNYFGPNDDLQLEVYVYTTSSSESANTLVAISSPTVKGMAMSFSDSSPLIPRVRTIGTRGISAGTLQDAVPQQKSGMIQSFGVTPLTESNASSSASASVAVGYSGENLNEVQGVSVSVDKIVNGRTGEEIDVSRLENGTTDSSGRAIITVPKPQGSWQGGWYTIYLKAQKTVNGEVVSDYGTAWFQIKSFWVWAYPSGWKWYFATGETVNITVEVRGVSNYAGVSGVNVSVEDVYAYGSEDGYMSSSMRANYTSNPSQTNENGTAVLSILPQPSWRTGWYNLRVLARNGNGSDEGYTGFSVRVYDVWGYGMDSSNNYKWAFSRDDNISLQVFVREPGNWYSNAAGVNVSILKVYDTTTWPYKDVTSLVNLTGVKNITNSQGARLTIPAPLNGSWGIGNYYTVIQAVNGTDATLKDSGTAWFSVRAFDIVAVPIRNSTYSYVFGINENITYNITVCKAGSIRTSYVNNNWVVTACTPTNSTIDDVHITTWSNIRGSYEIPINLTGNGTPSTASRLMTISRSGYWEPGWYSVNFKVYDAQNPEVFQSEYVGYSVRMFDVYVQPAKDYFSRAENASFNVTICQPGGCDYYYTGSNWERKAQYYTDEVNLTAATVYGPGVYLSSFSTKAISGGIGTYNLSPSSSWAEGGYSVSFTAVSGSRTQDAWGWFNVKTFTATGYAANWQYSAADNVTILITSTDPSGAPVNLSDVDLGHITVNRWPEGGYSYESVSLANVSWVRTAQGRAQVTLVPSGVWSQGYHYVNIPVTYEGSTQMVWASFYAKLFEIYTRPDYPAGRWYFTPSDNISINVSVCNQGTYNWYSSSCDYYANNVTVEVTEIYTYDTSTWMSRVIPYSASFDLNGTGRLILPLSNLTSGSYNVYMKVSDKNNPSLSERGYAWFELKNFELYVELLTNSSTNYFLPSDNITFRVSACLPGTRYYYWDYNLSRSLVNCSAYPSPVTATLSSLRRYDYSSGRSGDVAVRNVSVNFNGTGIISVSREDLYNSTLLVGEYYSDIRAYDTSNPTVSERYSTWFYVKLFEVISFPNTQEGWYFLPSENFTLNVSACMPGTINYLWNSTKYRSDPYCTPYSGNVIASLVVEYMYDLSTWESTWVNASATFPSFSGSSLISLNPASLPHSADGKIRIGYYNYRLTIADAVNGNVSDTTWRSAYYRYFDASVSAYSTPSGSGAVNLTLYAWARNGTSIAVDVSSVEIKKYDYSSYQYAQISISNLSRIGDTLIVTPSSAWSPGYYNVYVNMSRTDDPSAIGRTSGGFSIQ